MKLPQRRQDAAGASRPWLAPAKRDGHFPSSRYKGRLAYIEFVATKEAAMKSNQISQLGLVACLLCMASRSLAPSPLSPAFSYQGQLFASGVPANGTYNMEFRLYNAAASGSQIGSAQTLNGVSVADGVFGVTLNSANEFGATAFDGSRRWLEITVNGTVLSPKQEILATPYALSVRGIDGHSLDAPDGSPPDALIVDAAGRVGIGTTTP